MVRGALAALICVATLAVAQRCSPVSGTSTINVNSTTYQTTKLYSSTITLSSPGVTTTVSATATAVDEPPDVTVTGSGFDVITVFKTARAKTTKTVQTPKGFTAVKCETPYVRPRVTVTHVTTSKTSYTNFTYTSTIIASSTTTYTHNIYVATITERPYTDTYFPSTTTTSTISQATSTQYLACGSNNVVYTSPLNNNILTDGSQGYSNASAHFTFSSSPEDCCAQCHASATCAFSSFGDVPQRSNYTRCTLWLLPSDGSEKCDPSQIKGYFQGEHDSDENLEYISNGPCGQLVWIGDSG